MTPAAQFSCLDKLPRTFLSFHHSFAQTRTRWAFSCFLWKEKAVRREVKALFSSFFLVSPYSKARFPIGLLQCVWWWCRFPFNPLGERPIRASGPCDARLLLPLFFPHSDTNSLYFLLLRWKQTQRGFISCNCIDNHSLYAGLSLVCLCVLILF